MNIYGDLYPREQVLYRLRKELENSQKKIERLEIRLEERDFLIGKIMDWQKEKPRV